MRITDAAILEEFRDCINSMTLHEGMDFSAKHLQILFLPTKLPIVASNQDA